jgi:type I restriction enzyme S subunit
VIDDLKPYPEYTDSGLPWLDRVPSSWNVRRSKYLFREVDDRFVAGVERRLSMSQRYGLIPSDEVEEKRLVSHSNVGGKICERGDLVLNRLKAHLGVFALAPQRGVVSPDYTVFRSVGSVNRHYFCTVYRSPYCGQELRRRAKGIVEGFWRLYTDDFYDIRVPFPPPDEQAAIVRFLDHVNGKIERAIRTKRNLIALLNEQKQAIIHRAVTRGLDGTARLKPSGIPGLGDVPEHWEVTRIKNEFHCLNNRRRPLNAPERGMMTARLYDYYGASGVIDKVDDYIFDDALLLIAEDGANLVLRNLPLAIIARGKFWVNNHAHILKPKRGNIEYLAGFLETLNYRPWITGAAQPKLTKDRLMSIFVCVAPPDEQDDIVTQIDSITQPLSSAIGRTEREIALLREYRTTLIAEVVTGRLDVRKAAARLPADDDGPLAADDLPDELADDDLPDDEIGEEVFVEVQA